MGPAGGAGLEELPVVGEFGHEYLGPLADGRVEVDAAPVGAEGGMGVARPPGPRAPGEAEGVEDRGTFAAQVRDEEAPEPLRLRLSERRGKVGDQELAVGTRGGMGSAPDLRKPRDLLRGATVGVDEEVPYLED